MELGYKPLTEAKEKFGNGSQINSRTSNSSWSRKYPPQRLRDSSETVDETFSKQIHKISSVTSTHGSKSFSMSRNGDDQTQTSLGRFRKAGKSLEKINQFSNDLQFDVDNQLPNGTVLVNSTLHDEIYPTNDDGLSSEIKSNDRSSKSSIVSSNERKPGPLGYGRNVTRLNSNDEQRRPQRKSINGIDNRKMATPSLQRRSIVLAPLNYEQMENRKMKRQSPDLNSDTSSEDMSLKNIETPLNRTFQVNEFSRYSKNSGARKVDGFFSYISPPNDEKQEKMAEKKRSLRSMKIDPEKSKKSDIKKELAVSDLDDLEIQNSGHIMIANPIGANPKVKGEPITEELAIELKHLMFGNASRDFPPGWKGQAFEFNNNPDLKYGLVQHEAGPCGILACVQAYILKHLIFYNEPDRNEILESRVYSPSNSFRNNALCQAIYQILAKCAVREKKKSLGSDEIIVVIPGRSSNFQGGFVGNYKTDGITESLDLYRFQENVYGEFPNFDKFIASHIQFYTGQGNSAAIALLYSAILTRGIDAIRDVDLALTPLMGTQGYCSQEIVNLLLTGRATSNTFDGVKNFHTLALKGIEEKMDIGFLTLFEHYGSCIVGNFYKSPNCPIWVICSESHFTIIFSLTKGAEKSSTAEHEIIKLVYYDGLARQDEPINLELDCSDFQFFGVHELEKKHVPPLEHCLRTKWNDAKIFWKGCDPIY